MSTITDAAQAVAGLLRAAEDFGLPAPYNVSVTDYAPADHHGHTTASHGGASLLVEPSALAAWSRWLDVDAWDDGEPYKRKIHKHLDAFAGPVPIRVTALVPEAVASAATACPAVKDDTGDEGGTVSRGWAGVA